MILMNGIYQTMADYEPSRRRSETLEICCYCQATGTGTWDLGPGTWDLGPGNRIENRNYPQSQEMTVKSHIIELGYLYLMITNKLSL